MSWADVAAMSAEVEESEEEALPVAAPAPPQRPRASEVPSYAPPPRPSKGLSKGARSEPQAVWPSKGDFIQHRQFGLCKVEREDGQGGIVIKLESGIRKTIKLAYLEVGAPRTERGRRVFPIRPRRR